MEGVFGLWRGLGPSLFRDVPFSGIYWMTYESLKSHYEVKVPTFWFSFLGGAVSGSVRLIFMRRFACSTEFREFKINFINCR